MKKAGMILLGLLIGLLIGWGLGFLRAPMVDQNDLYWVGFIGGIASIALFFTLAISWNKNLLIVSNSREFIGKLRSNTTSLLWFVFLLFVVFISVINGFKYAGLNSSLQEENRIKEDLLLKQSKIIANLTVEDQDMMVSVLMQKVDQELLDSPNQRLSESTIQRIAALSYSMDAVQIVMADSSLKKLSAGRGQLLLALANSQMDSTSFAAIINEVSFEKADLRKANLKQLNLSGINLIGADMSRADLSAVILINAQLDSVNFKDANLEAARLDGAHMEHAQLNWAKMDNINLSMSILNGSDFRNARINRANLEAAALHWSDFEGATINHSKLYGADLFQANLKHANFSHSDLREARIRKASFKKAILTETQLSDAAVEDGWLEKLPNWEIAESAKLRKIYEIKKDTSGRYKKEKYLLKKIEPKSKATK